MGIANEVNVISNGAAPISTTFFKGFEYLVNTKQDDIWI